MRNYNLIFTTSDVLKYSDSDSTNKSIKDKGRPFPERALSEFTSLFTPPPRFITTTKNSDKMQQEIWKDIPGYDGCYQASTFGRIRSVDRPKFNNPEYLVKGKLRPVQKQKNGYTSIVLSRFGVNKRISVHRLIAITFIPNPESKDVVNHKNSIRDDNRLENLEWSTQSENILHGVKRESYFNSMSVRVLQFTLTGEFIKEWKCIKDVSKAFTGKPMSVKLNNCLKGNRKSFFGYSWRKK